MIVTLWRCRLRMAAHRVASSSRAERIGAGAAGLLLAGFVGLVLAALFADPAFLAQSLRDAGVHGLNRISLGLVQLVFLVVLAVSVVEEAGALYRAPDTELLLHLPLSPARLACFRLLISTVRLLLTSFLLAPLFVVYLYYFHLTGGWGMVCRALPFLSLAVVGGAASLAAVVILASSIAAWLLGRFRATTLVVGGLLAGAGLVAAGLRQLDGVAGPLALAGEAGGAAGGLLAFAPLYHLLASLELVDGSPVSTASRHLAQGVVGVVVAGTAAVGVMRGLVLCELGALRESARRLQCGTVSQRCRWPLTLLPGTVRALIHEEFIYLSRKLVLQTFLLALPIVAVPLFLPRAALELVGDAVVFACGAHVAVAFLSFSDLASLDLSQKGGFEALMRTLPVRLETVLGIKALARAALFWAAAIACLAGWAIRLPVSWSTGLALGASSAALSLSFVSLVGGLAYAGTALSTRAGSRLQPAVPALAGLAATAGGLVLLLGVVLALRRGLPELAALLVAGSLPAGLKVLRIGSTWLARRPLD